MYSRNLWFSVLIFAFTLPLASCSSKDKKKANPNAEAHLMGAGATFPNPLYQKWSEEFTKVYPKVEVEYDAVGSGKGVDKFLKEEVDFGASDGAMTDSEMAKVQRGVLLVPTTAGMIVLAYNSEGLPRKNLKLPRDVYVDIFLGKITKWDDERIAKANPEVKEWPNLPITVAVRQDGSGTTFAFTNHLAAVSDEWKKTRGAGKVIDWHGSAQRAAGNEGVAGLIKRTPGAVGYIEFGLAQRLSLPMAVLENKAGNFIRPVSGTGLSALLEHKMPDNFRDFIPDPAGKDSYPIITYTWMLLYKKYPDAKKAAAIKEFAEWCLTDGQGFCETLGFVRLPPTLAQAVLREIGKIE